MDLTRKALDKARRQRASAAGKDDRAPPSARPGKGLSDGRPHTRVIKTSPLALRENRIVAGLTNDAAADIFRMLRTQVMRCLAKEKHSTLAVCSAHPGEGKTLVAVNLAISLAMDAKHTVLLVDLDLRRPGVHTYFGIEPELGLTDYMRGRAALSDCLINTGYDSLVILPTHMPVGYSSEFLSLPRVDSLAQELKDRYPDRIVIYDLAPLLLTDDYLVFMQNVEACLLVVEEGTTKKDDIERAVELLKDSNLIGTVLNKSAQKTFSAYYYR